jgi:hypothetical protein
MKITTRLAAKVSVVWLVSLIAGATYLHFGTLSSQRPAGQLYQGEFDETEKHGRTQPAEFARKALRDAVSNKAELPIESASIDRLKKIRQCEKSEMSDAVEVSDCQVADLLNKTTPSGQAQALVDATVWELAFLRAIAEEDIQIGRASKVPLSKLATLYIKHPDDNVREQALFIAALLPSREAATVVQIAVQTLRTTVSGPLTVQALHLMKDARSANPELVDTTLRAALKTGGWEVRNAVATEILPFLTHENRKSFEQILAAAPVRSKLALHLRLGLEEFDRMERL